MNAELPYLKRIADAIGKINLGDGQSGASQNAGAGNVAVTATVEAPGVAETLDMGLLNTVIEEEETIKTSAVKAMADSIKNELLAAFFKEEEGVRTNLLESIHNQLRVVSDYSTLQGLRDVALTSGPEDGDFLVWKNQLGDDTWQKWTNIPASGILQQLLGSEQIGGADTLGDYHAIYWGGASFISIPGGAIADPNQNPAAHYPIVGWQVYSYLSGKAATKNALLGLKIGEHYDQSTGDSTDSYSGHTVSYFNDTATCDEWIPTARAVYRYIQMNYHIAESPDNLDNSDDLITGAILAAYVNEHGGTTPSLNGLSDTDLGTLANNNFLYYDSTAQKWKNATRATALQKLVGTSSAIGGGSGNKSPIYWTGSQFSAITLSEGAYRSVITTVNQIASGETSLVPAGLLASKLGNYLQATIVTSISASSSYQNNEVAAAGAVVDFVSGQVNAAINGLGAAAHMDFVSRTNYYNKIADNSDGDGYLITAGAVAKYVESKIPKRLNDLSTDVQINSAQDGDFLGYSATLGKWTDISSSNLLQTMIGSSAIGGQASSGAVYRPIYWGGASFIALSAGTVASDSLYPIHGKTIYDWFYNSSTGVKVDSITSTSAKVPSCYAVLQYVNKITDSSTSTWQNNQGCLTGSAMYGFIQESSLMPVSKYADTTALPSSASNDGYFNVPSDTGSGNPGDNHLATCSLIYKYIHKHWWNVKDATIGSAAACSLEMAESAASSYGSDSVIMTQKAVNYKLRNYLTGTIAYDEDAVKNATNEIVTGSAVKAALQYYGLIS